MNHKQLRNLAESYGATPTDSRDPDNKVVLQMTLAELRNFAENYRMGIIQHSDELVSRTPSEKAAYQEGVKDGKMYAVRDGLKREDVGLIADAIPPTTEFHGMVVCHKYIPNATQDFIPAKFYREREWGDEYSKVQVYTIKKDQQ